MQQHSCFDTSSGSKEEERGLILMYLFLKHIQKLIIYQSLNIYTTKQVCSHSVQYIEKEILPYKTYCTLYAIGQILLQKNWIDRLDTSYHSPYSHQSGYLVVMQNKIRIHLYRHAKGWVIATHNVPLNQFVRHQAQRAKNEFS